MKSAWLKKTSQEKSVYICEICGTKFSSDFAELWTLANGSRPICAAIVFGHADFANDADFSSWEGLVPQISQIYTDFLWNLWWIPLSDLRGYQQRPNRSPLRNSVSNRRSRKPPNKFRVVRWKKSASSAKSAWLKNVPKKICVYLWNLWDFFQSQGVSFLRGIIFVPQISQIYTDFLWILWWITLSDLRGYLQRPNRSPLRNSVSNRRSRKSPNKFRGIRWWKKSAPSAKSAWLKKRPKKNLCKSVKSVGQKNN